MAPEPLVGIEYRDDGTTTWVDEVAATRFLWQDSDPALATWAFHQLHAQYSLWTEKSPIDRWPDVESTYILCTEDRLVSPEWARRAAQAKLRVRAVEIPGGHSPFLSRPAELAEALCQDL
jgi:pimeloyl-ACP methyl ester carboxylesterase